VFKNTVKPETLASPAADKAQKIRAQIPEHGLFADKEWRISPEPLAIDPKIHAEFEALGPRLRKFYAAADRLYRESVLGNQPAWIAERLDAGKPESLLEIARDPQFENDLPAVIRPDILLTEDGWKITELDSVPGGIGLTAWLQQAYHREEVMAEGFRRAFTAANDARNDREGGTAIVVSEEAGVYRPEMEWLARRLSPRGSWLVVSPEDLEFMDGGIFARGIKLAIVYRFFELFDLPNIQSSNRLVESALRGEVRISAPVKPWLEEKMLLALFWSGSLEGYWKAWLGEEDFAALRRVIPQTWIVEPEALDWNALKFGSQKKRRMVLKLSGFSELAWGGRSIRIGHDLPAEEWSKAVDHALASLPKSPYVLQPFEKGRRVHTDWFDFEKQELMPMDGRVRLCPFYFGKDANLSGILATICPADKKIIHGMRDAVMTLATS